MTNLDAKTRAVGLNTHLSSTEKKVKSLSRELGKMFGHVERIKINTHVHEHFQQVAWRVIAEADKKVGLNTEGQVNRIVEILHGATHDMKRDWERCASALHAKEEECRELRKQLKAEAGK